MVFILFFFFCPCVGLGLGLGDCLGFSLGFGCTLGLDVTLALPCIVLFLSYFRPCRVLFLSCLNLSYLALWKDRHRKQMSKSYFPKQDEKDFPKQNEKVLKKIASSPDLHIDDTVVAVF
jgi:hypothetical protein